MVQFFRTFQLEITDADVLWLHPLHTWIVFLNMTLMPNYAIYTVNIERTIQNPTSSLQMYNDIYKVSPTQKE